MEAISTDETLCVPADADDDADADADACTAASAGSKEDPISRKVFASPGLLLLVLSVVRGGRTLQPRSVIDKS